MELTLVKASGSLSWAELTLYRAIGKLSWAELTLDRATGSLSWVEFTPDKQSHRQPLMARLRREMARGCSLHSN